MTEARDLMNAIALSTINESIFHCRWCKVCPTLGCKEHSVNGRKTFFIHPSPGYFGKAFNPAENVLFVAQNPGKPTISRQDEAQYKKDLKLGERMELYGETLKSYYMTSNIASLLHIPWTAFAWTNVVKCPTQDNRMISNKEFALCSPYLKKQLDIINPSLVVTIGHWAASFLTGSSVSYGVNFQMRRVVVSMPHYSRADITDWIGTLCQFLQKARVTSASIGKRGW